MNYYNEHDPKKAAWLRELIKANVVAPGEVDERSILDVQPGDLAGFRQCHFFAGIGVWSYALRRAGVGDGEEVWTGSCPCQPFSAAGKRAGFADERHLFPAWFRLIEARRPQCVFGEQVSNGDGLAWLDAVRDSMDAAGYTLGVVDLCSAGFGSPNIRQRLFFVADAETPIGRRTGYAEHTGRWTPETGGRGAASIMADANEARPQGRGERGDSTGERAARSGGVACGVGDAEGSDGSVSIRGRRPQQDCAESRGPSASGGPTNGFWRDAEWVWCRDERWRPTEPGTFPLATGAPARVLRLRGYGDAINGEVAAAFIRAYYATRRP